MIKNMKEEDHIIHSKINHEMTQQGMQGMSFGWKSTRHARTDVILNSIFLGQALSNSTSCLFGRFLIMEFKRKRGGYAGGKSSI
jgi:hypothetical protein